MTTNNSMAAMPDLSKLPGIPPPAGVQFNFDNPDNYKSANIILHSIVLSITTIIVAVRVYTRAMIKKSIGVDDYLSVLSWALSVNFSVLLGYATKYGFGHHIWDIPASNLINAFKWLTISEWSYFPVILSIKLCILIGYNRLFQVNRLTKWLIWFGLCSISVFYVVCFFLEIFYCTPVERAWNRTLPGHCVTYAALPLATGIFNTISDFYLLALPMPVIFGLSMELKRRIRIASVFGLGLFTCITSILRLVATEQHIDDLDQTYISAKALHWAVLEINVGLICSCATALPAFFDASSPRSFGSLINKLMSSRATSPSELTKLASSEEKGEAKAARSV